MARTSNKKPPKRAVVAKPHPFFAKKTPAILDPDALKQAFQVAYDAKRFVEAREIALSFASTYPQVGQAWSDASVCSVYLEDWQLAIDYGLRAVRLMPNHPSTLDALAHAYGAIFDWVNVQKYGVRSLIQGDIKFGQNFYRPWVKPPTPIFNHDAHKNIISFSLFGGNSKYGETAVLNVIDQPHIYPGWTCRFYIDDTVPEHIVGRLRHYGAQVVMVDEVLKKWPAPMWRFAAYDDPEVDRVIFRDADSVISEREAGAVREWIQSGQAFHMMRDGGSHTELILAGLWGCVRGSLPPMIDMVNDFLKKPVDSQHFADQYFLREYVWPYARQDICQHDSLFGFMEGKPFPDGPHQDDFHTGYAEGSPFFSSEVDAPDGTVVHWTLYQRAGEAEQAICCYPATVQNKQIHAHLPQRYILRLEQDMLIRIEL
jgi:hypothetical protein